MLEVSSFYKLLKYASIRRKRRGTDFSLIVICGKISETELHCLESLTSPDARVFYFHLTSSVEKSSVFSEGKFVQRELLSLAQIKEFIMN